MPTVETMRKEFFGIVYDEIPIIFIKATKNNTLIHVFDKDVVFWESIHLSIWYLVPLNNLHILSSGGVQECSKEDNHCWAGKSRSFALRCSCFRRLEWQPAIVCCVVELTSFVFWSEDSDLAVWLPSEELHQQEWMLFQLLIELRYPNAALVPRRLDVFRMYCTQAVK